MFKSSANELEGSYSRHSHFHGGSSSLTLCLAHQLARSRAGGYWPSRLCKERLNAAHICTITFSTSRGTSLPFPLLAKESLRPALSMCLVVGLAAFQ